jgi:hypothetical protein
MSKSPQVSLDAEALVAQMLAAAAKSLRKDWPKARTYAELEIRKLVATLLMIQALHAAGQLSAEEARLLLDMQKNATRSVLLTLRGLGIIAVEKAINAALKVVRQAINTALGFALL